MSDQPKITAFHSDDGVVLQTAGGAVAVLPPADAARLAAALLRAIEGWAGHQELVRDIESAFPDEM